MGVNGPLGKLAVRNAAQNIVEERIRKINEIAQSGDIKFAKYVNGYEKISSKLADYEGLPLTYFDRPQDNKQAEIMYEQASKLLKNNELRQMVRSSAVYFIVSGSLTGKATNGFMAFPGGIIDLGVLGGHLIPKENIDDIYYNKKRCIFIKLKNGDEKELVVTESKKIKEKADEFIDLLKFLYCSEEGNAVPDIQNTSEENNTDNNVNGRTDNANTAAGVAPAPNNSFAASQSYGSANDAPVIEIKKKKTPKIVLICAGIFFAFVIYSFATGNYESDDPYINIDNSESVDTQGGDTSSSVGLSDSMTVSELFNGLGEGEEMPYTVTEKANQFLAAHPELFPAATEEECLNYVDYDVEYKHINKNPDIYGDKLVYIMGTISEIYELPAEQTVLNKPFTMISVMDYDGNMDVIYYPDSVELYEGDSINGYVLPLNKSTSGVMDCIVYGGAYINGYQN